MVDPGIFPRLAANAPDDGVIFHPVTKIRFQIRGVTAKELIKTYCQGFRLLDGQMDIGDFLPEDQAGEGAAGAANQAGRLEKEKK